MFAALRTRPSLTSRCRKCACGRRCRGPKILAIGLNYADHIAETGREKSKRQVWFAKMSNAVNGPYDPIQIPRVSNDIDYEAEFVFVIGKRCRHVPKEKARDVIF